MAAVSLMDRLNALSPARRFLLAAGLIFAMTLLAYSSSFNAGFHFDDFHTVVKNQNVRSTGNIPRFFTDAGMASYIVGNKGYRPVTTLSYAVNYAVSGYRVWSYHVLNFMLHFINALLVCLVVASVLKAARYENASSTALVAAAVFALHPIQTGGVTYVSGRALLLASLFTLSAFYCFLRFRAGDRYPWAAAVPCLFLLGLLSKEFAVCLVGLMLAYDWLFPRSGRVRPAYSIKAWLPYLPVILALLGYLAYKRHLAGFIAVDEFDYGVGQYLMSEAGVFMMYLRLLLLPVNQNADYDLPVTNFFGPEVAVSLLLVVAVLFLLYRLRRNYPAVSFFGLWFFIALAPESSLVPIRDVAVEYRLYLASAGFIAALCLAAREAVRPGAARRAAAVAVMALFGLLTFSRNSVWADEYSLWSDAARKSPYSARSHANLGNALLGKKLYMEALNELNRSLAINPFYDQSYNVYTDQGICFYELGLPDEAIAAFERSIKVNPGYVEGYANLGAVYYKTGRYGEAVGVFFKAATLDPGYAQAHFNLAMSYGRLGRVREALAEMETARGLSPMDFSINYNLALIYEQSGMGALAEAQGRTAAGLAVNGEEKADAEGLLADLAREGRGPGKK